jgi:hypothetical protein
MAIALRSSSTTGYEGVPGMSAGGTPAEPAGAAEGDVMVYTVYNEDSSGITTIDPPTGWTALTPNSGDHGGVTAMMFQAYIVRTSSAPSRTWAYANSGAGVASISAFTGVDTTTPIDASGSYSSQSGTPNTSSVTTATANAMLLWASGDYNAGQTDDPTGFTAITAANPLFMSYKLQAGAGASGALTGTGNATGWCRTLALKPAVTVSAAITGTAQPSATETEIVAGGETIIITLTGDTWIAAGAGSFDLQRDEIIAGIDSAQSEALGWDAVPKITQSLGGVVRTSDTVVTITLDAFATYSITANETITVTVPGTALTGGSPIVASPTFSITDVSSTAVRDIIGMGVVPFAR